MGDRDYSGVSTAALAEAIHENVPEDYEIWAESIGISARHIRRIFAVDYQFTGLGIADKICHSFGRRVDDLMVVIPSDTKNAAEKMAKDELEVLAESMDLPTPTAAEIMDRAAELQTLRQQTLGDPTPEQYDRLSRDSDRTKDRLSRMRKEMIRAVA